MYIAEKTAFELAEWLAGAIREMSESYAQWIELTISNTKFHMQKGTSICAVCGSEAVIVQNIVGIASFVYQQNSDGAFYKESFSVEAHSERPYILVPLRWHARV